MKIKLKTLNIQYSILIKIININKINCHKIKYYKLLNISKIEKKINIEFNNTSNVL